MEHQHCGLKSEDQKIGQIVRQSPKAVSNEIGELLDQI